jgi:hypothetical protein
MPSEEELEKSVLKPKLEAWRAQFEPIIQAVVGKCKCTIPPQTIPAPASAYLSSPIHDVLAHAVASEFLHQLGIDWPNDLLFIQNHYSMVRGIGLQSGPVRYGQIKELLQFANQTLLVELSGAFIIDIVRHNAKYICRGDFMVASGLEDAYVLRDGEGPIPDTLSKVDFQGGAAMAKHPCIGGKPVKVDCWYPVLIGDYQLDTTLAGLPGHAEGIRNRQALGADADASMAELVISYLKRGEALDLVTSWGGC